MDFSGISASAFFGFCALMIISHGINSLKWHQPEILIAQNDETIVLG